MMEEKIRRIQAMKQLNKLLEESVTTQKSKDSDKKIWYQHLEDEYGE